MIRSALKLGFLLIVGIIAYNSFFGTAEEKAEAKEMRENIVDATKTIGGVLLDFGKKGVELIKKERAKFSEGKYDDAMDKVSGLLGDMKKKVEGTGGEMLDKVKELEKAKDALGIKLDNAKDEEGEISNETKKKLKAEFDELMDQTEDVLKQIDAKGGE